MKRAIPNILDFIKSILAKLNQKAEFQWQANKQAGNIHFLTQAGNMAAIQLI